MRSVPEKKHSLETSTEVTPQEKVFLVHGNSQIPINAKCASKFSLSFRYEGKQQVTDKDQPVNLLLQKNGQSIELGPFRIVTVPDEDGYAGRLVCIKDVFDFRKLLLEKKVIKLQAPLRDLPVIFARRKDIHQSFKDYTANLSYDLSVYKKIFDDLDSQYCDEPEDVRKSIQKAIIDAEAPNFFSFFNGSVLELGSLVSGFSQEEHQVHGFYFRRQLWNFIQCCALMARTNTKPRGYAGDSEMMRMIYQNEYLGETTFCKLIHKYTMGVPACDSVRNRRKLIVEMLNQWRKTPYQEPTQRIRVLSVACGPACELSDILTSPSDFEKYHFSLLDQDPLALNEAAQLISEIEANYSAELEVEYINMSVRIMLGKPSFRQILDKFHFIYSMGLFDYLVAPVAKAIIKKLYEILSPGGELLVGNFHVSNPSKYFMEYWGDWYLFHRSEEEFEDLTKDLSTASVSTIFESTGSQMFLRVIKL